jgi:5'-3' exoribonuclease 2
MGVPAFYRWLSEKYPKVVQDVLEDRVQLTPGSHSVRLPFDATRPNPSGLECDNLYIDMNGIIHPCSHPENGPQPATEQEMYENVCRYVDRLFRVMRPRKLLYLAVDGVAPRAKMNQQRSRRFRSAQEAKELHELEQHIREELTKSGQRVPPTKKAWDSNVITPGTPFMLGLAEYIRFYIRKRLSTDRAWKNVRVIFSDASLPGEGEHKIMSHIRLQRAQPGYNPNTVHVLHGLDADLIMLALATHEAHFYISREEVLFGRRSQEAQEQRQLESGFKDQQRALDEAAGADAMALPENQHKPLQRISIPILREYLAAEFASCLTQVPFPPSLERLIDDIVFLCFFVGNDFLPHLPSLDIRDGALDFLFNVYKRILPGLGDYMTKSGGNVNLTHVDVILAEVGSIEDYVFSMKYENEQRNKRRIEEQKALKKAGKNASAPPLVAPVEHHARRGRSARILEKQAQQQEDVVALSTKNARAREKLKVTHRKKDDNSAAAQALKESLTRETVKESVAESAEKPDGVSETEESRGTKRTRPENDGEAEIGDTAVTEVKAEADADGDEEMADASATNTVGVVGDVEEEFEDDANDDDEEEEEDENAPKIDDIDEEVDPEAARIFKERVKAAQEKQLDTHAKTVEDKVRLHEAGWKDRYYSDKCKADDVKNHGGREHLFRSYVMGLCWVMKYYYDGCASWKWYYPFHYGPFASDLKNIERFEKDCKSFELSTPFNPVEQLMAVLPPDSAHAIPKASRWLLTDPESPIIDFYPSEVPVDPNGKAMPWLWVVLLPFIDEERLLAALSPTMAKWSKTELLCNARGLDDGYLYVNRSHPLTKKLSIVLKGAKSANAPKTRLTDAAVYGCPGFSGSIRPPLSNEIYPIEEDTIVPPPSIASKIESLDFDSIFLDSIEPNDAVCVAFTEPLRLSHKSVLLPGAQVPRATLTANDKIIRRPRLNRGGGTIANMGMSTGQSYREGQGSMNIGSYERNLAQRTGRGNEMYQPGTRAWGAMEPAPKRPRSGPPPIQNPLMNQGWYSGPPHQVSNYSQPPWQAHNQQRNQPYDQRQRQPAPPQQNYIQGYQQQPPPYQGNGQQRYQNDYQQHPPYHGNGQQAYQNGGRSGYPPMRSQQSYPSGQSYQPPPQQRQQGYDFRSYKQQPTRPYGQQQQHRPPQQHTGRPQAHQGQQQGYAPRSRVSSDVMNNLRAQLTSTLNKNRSQSGQNRHTRF